MNDLEIRQNFHFKKLRRQHAHKDTFVIDELGLNHGKNRADIAVINGHFIGYEIKSNNDSLIRLKEQIKSYNAIFNKVYIIIGERYRTIIHNHIPEWWGIFVAFRGKRNAVNFDSIRKAGSNEFRKPIFIARLLWRNEAAEILEERQVCSKFLRQPRAILYEYLVDTFEISELEKYVIKYLKQRKNWRYPVSPL